MNRKLVSRIINLISFALLILVIVTLLFSANSSGSFDLIYIFVPLLIVMIIFSVISRLLNNSNTFDNKTNFNDKYAEKTIFSQKQTQPQKKTTFKKDKSNHVDIDFNKNELINSKNSIYKTIIDKDLDVFIDSVNNREYKPGDSKYTHHCSNCNALIHVDDAKCPVCGKVQERFIKCSYCGHKNRKGTVLCEKCGNLLY